MRPMIRRGMLVCAMVTLAATGQLAGHETALNNVLTLTKVNSGTIARANISTTDKTGFHHIMATKSGPPVNATVKLYIDGVDRTGTVTNRTIANTSTALNIGRDTAGSQYFSGLIDEVAVYSVALSAAQIQRTSRPAGDENHGGLA